MSLAMRFRDASKDTIYPKPAKPMIAIRNPMGIRENIRIKSAAMPMMPMIVGLILFQPPPELGKIPLEGPCRAEYIRRLFHIQKGRWAFAGLGKPHRWPSGLTRKQHSARQESGKTHMR